MAKRSESSTKIALTIKQFIDQAGESLPATDPKISTDGHDVFHRTAECTI